LKPLSFVHKEPVPQIQNPNGNLVQNVLDLPRADILILEDETLMSALMQRYLKTLGASDFKGHRQSDGPLGILNLESGWELLNADLGHIKVAIVDILLPQVTGVDLIRDFRRRYPNMGIVPVSGMATEPMKRSLKDLLPEGFDLVNKPLRREEFIGCFQKAWQFAKSGAKRPVQHATPIEVLDPQAINAIEESYWSAGVSQSQPEVSTFKRKKLPKKAA
jgi:CheY-like chemotaxis protein